MIEFTNTDAELARCIKSRIRHELGQLPSGDLSLKIVREYMTDLTQEIINKDIK